MQVTRLGKYLGILVFALSLLVAARSYAGVTASISGTVKDSSGGVVVGAKVTATNTDTGIVTTQSTNGDGYYSFQSLPLGHYDIGVEQTGFKSFRQKGLVLDVNAALVVDVTLQVGQVSDKVEVSSEALHVETANTQMGEVIEGSEMTAVPLVKRSYTDLLALQPGVVSQSSGLNGALGGQQSGKFLAATFAIPLVSGDLNAGALSVNGQREAANGYILNGVTVQEAGFSGAGAVPNLDSIAEFRILTNNFDAEYGNYSGGQINVVTKSGTNQWHGNAFEFLRNTKLDAANFFESGNRGVYQQNQFGGTFGGPIRKDKLFFFADYQGNRVIQAIPETINGAPTAALIGGDLTSVIPNLLGNKVVSGPVSGPGSNPNNWANQLSAELGGQPIMPNEPYYTVGCTTTAQCVFPNAHLDPTHFNPISKNELGFIQPANNGAQNAFFNNSGKLDLHDNKFSGRVDANSGFGLLSAYYYFDNFNRIDPYWAAPGPLYPGFSIKSQGRTNSVSLGDTKTFGSATVNEARFGFFRLDTPFNQPLGGTQKTLAQLGFASGANRQPGILPLAPQLQGVPETDFNSFSIGVPSKPIRITQNSYQVLDNFSKVIGTHTVKFGGQYHYNQLEENLLSNASDGNVFFGTAVNGGTSETGSDFVDFLIGAPSSIIQGEAFPSYGRSFYLGLYGQDSWRIKSNLTFNYGLRYDVNSFWHEKYHEIQTIIPGEQSVVIPGSPTGWVFPGDPRVPSSLAPTRWNNFGPRLGLAYSFGDHEGALGKVLGKPGATSIRVGYGIFYTALEGATDFVEIGDAPFGDFTGQFGSTYAAPFTNRQFGTSISNFFPVLIPPKHFSASNPITSACTALPPGVPFCPYDTLAHFFSAFGQIGSSPAFFNGNKSPYAENYELSIQRQITSSDLVTLSYVGTQGHHLLLAKSANPGNPALCLQLAVAGCGPGGENNIYVLPNNSFVLSTRAVLPGVVLPAGTDIGASSCSAGSNSTSNCILPNGLTGIVPFGNDSYFINMGNSAYNSAQVNWRHTSGRLQTLLGYTFSKAIDLASGFGEQVNPVNPKLSRGLSAFDSTHNFVLSYSYRLPIDMLGGPKRLTNGWEISGITRFSTGLPITLVETDDQSLLGTNFGGPIPLNVDTPNLVAPVKILDPRKSACPGPCLFFDPSSFQGSALGQEGNANRRFFHGPGVNNWDFAVLKNTQINERFNLQFRAELFNIFNHAQFIAPSQIGLSNFNPASTTASFGSITVAAPPRIVQLSLKLNF